MLSDEEVERIASAVVEKAREDVGIRDVIIGSAMGEGAIPLYGRETRKELCSCCLIEPEGPNVPENRMCTTKSAIGTLKDSEEREWCSEINIVSDGRCARARSIREAARECKEKYPEDTEAFFKCYIPAFSQATRESNPGTPYQEEGKRIAQQLGNGVIYNGPWISEGKYIGHTFSDVAVTGTTFICHDLEDCKAKLVHARKVFRAEPPTFRGNPKTKYLARLDPALATRASEEKVFDSPDEAIAYAETLKAKMLPGDVVHVREGIGFEYKVIYRYQMSNPGNPYPRMTIPEPYARRVRAELRKIPTLRLKQAYEALGAGKATGIEVVEADRAHALSAIREILWERGQLPPEETELVADMILEGKV